MRESTRRYRGFISYSQRDKKAAARLHRALEAFRVPKGINTTAIDGNPRRLGRFFRDDEEMGAAAHLGAALQGAIADSESLIVLCSPHAAQSRWVNEEILHFRRTGRADRIYAIIIAGKPNSGSSKTECFPPALRSPQEPLALDVRKDGWPRLVTRLAAGLISAPFDELWKRERRRRNVTARRLTVAAATLATIVIGGGWSLWRETTLTYARAALLASLSPSLSHEQRLRLAVLAFRVSALNRGRLEAGQRLEEILAEPATVLRARTLEAPPIVQAIADRSVAYNEAIQRFASLHTDGVIRVWSIETGDMITSFHADGARTLSFSGDGRRILTTHCAAGAEPRVAGLRVWDTASSRRLSAFAPGCFWAASLTSDGSRVIASNEGVSVWDAASGRQIASLPASHVLSANADGSRIVVNSEAERAFVWDVASGDRMVTLTSSDHRGVQRAEFSPDGTRLVAFSPLGPPVVWDVATGRALTATPDIGSETRSVVFSPDGSRIAATSFNLEWPYTAHRQAILRVLNESGYEVVELHGHRGDLDAVSFTRDSAQVVAVDTDGAVRVWDAENGRELSVVRGVEGWAFGAAITDGGVRVITFSESSLRLWGPAVRPRESIVLRGHTAALRDLSFSPDGTRILTTAHDGTARIWDSASGDEFAVLRGHATDLVRSASFNADGERVVTAGWDGTARIWDVATAREIAVLHHERNETSGEAALQDAYVEFAVFSPDGGRILTGVRGRAHIWDAVSGRQITVLRGHEGVVTRGEFSPDGRRVLTNSYDRTARVWDAATGRQILMIGDVIGDLAYSADGSRLIQTPYLGQVWDASNGRELEEKDVSRLLARRPWMTHDNTLVIAHAFDDLEIRTIDDGDALTIRMHDGAVRRAAFAPHDRRLLIGSESGRVHVFGADSLFDPTWRARYDVPYLLQLVCEGRLSAGASIITEADVAATPILRNRLGHDVCSPRRSLWQRFRAMLSPGAEGDRPPSTAS